MIKKFLVSLGYPGVWLIKKLLGIAIKIIGLRVKFKLKFKFKFGFKVAYVTLTILFILATLTAIFIYYEIFSDLPDVNLIYNPPKLSTKIYDRNERLLYKFYQGENRTWVPLEKIPQSLIWATIAAEDKDFYKHHGLSLRGTMAALWFNIRNNGDNKLRGGSTITQQLIKNIFFSNEQSLKRKIKEAVLAIQVENKLNKNEILERYINQVPYGGETYGAQEAALKYFGKNVWEIDMAQAAYLAGLPAAPSSYSPYDKKAVDSGKLRQEHVVREMVSNKYITEEKGRELIGVKLKINQVATNIAAPHFVFYIKNLLNQKYGYENFDRMGLKVVTSLDMDLQNKVDGIVKDEILRAKPLRISNGAAMVINVKSGDILAMSGSKDYWASDIDGKYNVTTALRQPGSSIKPINYLLAFQRGKTLMTPIDDAPVTYEIRGQKPYSPHNYNGKFMGAVTLKTALASSLNIPSVKLLAEDGVDNMITLGEKMGITTWENRSRFGLALALGSGEVKMVDMAQAYSIFANLGKKVEVNPIVKIDNYLGENIYQKIVESQDLIDPASAFLIDSALSDDNARAPIFGLNSKLVIPGKTVAVKTGTTNSLKDNWAIGWTPTFLTATWVGNNDNSPMSWVASGVSGATPIWNRIMKLLLTNKSDEKWSVPSGIERKNVCGKDEYFISGTEGGVKCIEPKATPTPTSGT